MKLPLTGGCQCGAIRYEITQAPRLVYTCHCTDCQRFSGSAFAMSVVVEENGFHLRGPELRPVPRVTDSGRRTNRWLCPDCCVTICGGAKPGSAPPDALRGVRAGTLDDSSWVRPTLHFWTRSAQPWVVLPEGGRRFETQPDDFARLMAGSGSAV